METVLICPVTQETFKHPVNLNCGHMFDKLVIDKLQNKCCPLCNCKITAVTTNRYIASLLNLTIATEPEKISKYHRSQAVQNAEQFKTNRIDDLTIAILNRVIEQSKCGMRYLKVKYEHYDSNHDYCFPIAQKIKNEGYDVAIGKDRTWIEIKW